MKDILTKICYVYGNKIIFDQFQELVYKNLEMQKKDEKMNEIKAQNIEDLENFTIATNVLKIKLCDTLNIKTLLYRSITLFISALARIHNIRALSCFDIVEELAKQKLISENCKHKLIFSVALACEINLTLPSQQCNAGPAKALYGQLCGPCEGSPYRTRIDLAAGPEVAPHGFNHTGFVAT